MQRVDLNEIISGAADTARPTAESRRLEIVLRTAPAPAEVFGDPSRLMQIVMNLVTNAMKFTPPGGCVTIEAVLHDAAVELSVSDTGQGVAPEFMPRLFDRFSQADDTAARVHGGLGLGLSIVKNLTGLHGGEVSARSGGPGQGAVFVVRFPRAMDAGQPAGALVNPEPAGDASVAGLRVLLVEDHADVLEAHARLLSEHGAVVTTAPSALAALALLAGQRFDVLVSDLGMPGLDGYGLIRRVRHELNLDAGMLPALAVTAFVRSEDRDAALEAGYQRCLQKPVSPVHFVQTVAQLGRPPGGRPLRALFVEDNDDLREQITWMLEEEGLRVRAFDRAEAALACYAPDRVDLVITDVSLSGMSGVELARAILRRAPDAWVVFSSGYAMGNLLGDFGPNVRALLKPFEFADVRRLTDEVRAGLGLSG
jgi:CheY-like chemotaxis protein